MAEKMTLARPYAKAAFEYACANNVIDDWSAMLQNAASMVRDSRVSKIISNPELTSEQRSSFFTKQKLFDKSFCNFIGLTASYGRLTLLPEMSNGFELLKLNYNQEVDVLVTSAVELDNTQKEKLTEALNKKLSRKVNLTFTVDNELIGGMFIKMGDKVIDCSVRGQLKKMLSSLIH